MFNMKPREPSTWSRWGTFFAAALLALPTGATGDAVAQEPRKDILLFTSILGPDGSQIFRVNANGSGRLALTPSPRESGISAADPALSADGKRIVFVAKIVKEDIPAGGLYVMNADGSARKRVPVKLAGGAILAPKWSPDGKRIAFCTVDLAKRSTRKPYLYLVDADGQNLKRLEKADGLMPTWSPDGKRLLFTLFTPADTKGPEDERKGPGIALYSVDVEGTNVRPFVKDAFTGAWSPDGKSLAYVVLDSLRIDVKAAGLFLARADGSEPKRLAGGGEDVTFSVQWSTDGKRLFFAGELKDKDNEKLPRCAIRSIDIDGRNPRRVTSEKRPEYLGACYLFAPFHLTR